MPHNYLDTPATERDDVSLAQVPALDFSLVQPFASPSKNPAEDLRNKMRRNRGAQQQYPTRTPRMRGPLVDRRNAVAPAANLEFSPLLKSAARKQIVKRSIIEEKENVLSSGIPNTPAVLKSSYMGDGTQLPLHSSMIDASSMSASIAIESGARVEDPISSSMLSATPMPALPGQGGMLDQGNILTLRDQEAKLDQIQKDNFGLKLKIHYLEEALRKTGSEFHQATLKENAELKTERATIDVDQKRLRKRQQTVEQELEYMRQKQQELMSALQAKNADQHLAKELAEAQQLAEARLKLTNEQAEKIAQLQSQLQKSQQDKVQHEDVQALKDDIEDLKQDLRGRDEQLDAKDDELDMLKEKLALAQESSRHDDSAALRDEIEDLKHDIRHRDEQLDSKDDELDTLKEKLTSANSGNAELEHMQQDIDDLEAELKERDEELDARNTKLAQLGDQLNIAYDREKSTQKLRADVQDLEAELRQRSQDLEDAVQHSRQTLAAKEADVQSLRNQLAEQQAERVAKQELHMQECEDLRSELREARRTNGHAKEASAVERFELEEARSTITTLKRSLEAERRDLESKRAANLSLENDVSSLRSKWSQQEALLRNELDGEKVQAGSLRQEIDALRRRSELGEEGAKILSLMGENEALQARHMQSEARLRSELGSSKARIASLEEDLSILKSKSTQQESLLRNEFDRKQATASHLENEISALKTRCAQHETRLRLELDNLRASLTREHDAAKQSLEDEVVVLEASLEDAEAKSRSLATNVQRLREELSDLQAIRGQETPAKQRRALRADLASISTERDDLAAKIADLERELRTAERNDSIVAKEHTSLTKSLEDAQAQMKAMQMQIGDLEKELELAREEKTIADERQDLHDLVKSAKIEAEQLQIKLSERDRKLIQHNQRELDLRSQLDAAQLAAEDLQGNVDELEARLRSHSKRESNTRAQLKELRDAKARIEELELTMENRNGSSDVHTRKETELRSQLRDCRASLQNLQMELAEKDDRLLALSRREFGLKDRPRKARAVGDDTINAHVDELRIQLVSAQGNVLALQQQLAGRSKTAKAHQRVTATHDKAALGDDCINFDLPMDVPDNNVLSTRHKQEMKGLAKQIRFLQAKCEREERLRRDLVYVKRWFLLQVEMYNECNQADLRLLEDIGITPDQTFRESRPSLRAAVLAVMAVRRMQKLSEDWASKKRSQAALMSKLEGMKKTKAKLVN